MIVDDIERTATLVLGEPSYPTDLVLSEDKRGWLSFTIELDESTAVTFDMLQKLSEAFGTKLINVQATATGYCRTCSGMTTAIYVKRKDEAA